MIYDVCLMGIAGFAAFWAPRVLPAPLNSLSPALGWLASMAVLWNTSRFSSALVVLLQSTVCCLLFLRYGTFSLLLGRVFYFPLCSSCLAAFGAHAFRHEHKYTVAVIAAIQLWSIFSSTVVAVCLPVSVLSTFSPQIERDYAKARTVEMLTNSGLTIHTPSVEYRSGIILDSIAVMTKDPSERWVFYSGGNGEFLEHSLATMVRVSVSLNANLILFNPRGVGKSTGYVWDINNLVDDAAAVIYYYIKQYRVDTQKMLLFGHSIGGGVVAKLGAKHFPLCPIFIDRSFSKLSDAAVNFSPFSPKLTKAIFPYLVGDLDSIRFWNEIKHSKKLITFAKDDEIIMYATSSLGRLSQFAKGEADENKVLELHGSSILSWHNSPIVKFDEIEEILRRLNQFLS